MNFQFGVHLPHQSMEFQSELGVFVCSRDDNASKWNSQMVTR